MATGHGFVTDLSRLSTATDYTEEELESLQKDIDSLFRTSLDPLDLSKELKMRAEEELNEHPEGLRRNVEALRRIVEDDELLNARLDDVFLTAFLRGRKHDVAKAYQCIKSYYEFKARYPEFYSFALPSEMPELFDQNHFGSLAGRDSKGRKICACIPARMQLDKLPMSETFKLGTSTLELMLSDIDLQVTGTVLIFDLADLTIIQQARLITPSTAWHLAMIVQDKIPLRLKAVHIVNQPLYFNAIFAVFKPFLKKKLRKRIFLHGNDMSSLHNHIAPEDLPEDWGGTRPKFTSNLTRSLIHLNEHKFKEWSLYTYKL